MPLEDRLTVSVCAQTCVCLSVRARVPVRVCVCVHLSGSNRLIYSCPFCSTEIKQNGTYLILPFRGFL